MQEFKKHHTKPKPVLRFAALCAAAVLLFAVAGVLARSAWGMYGTLATAASAREDAEKSLKTLEEDEARIRATVAALGSQAGIEKEVRERFGVARQSEGEIQIVRDSPQQEADSPESRNGIIRMLRSIFVW